MLARKIINRVLLFLEHVGLPGVYIKKLMDKEAEELLVRSTKNT